MNVQGIAPNSKWRLLVFSSSAMAGRKAQSRWSEWEGGGAARNRETRSMGLLSNNAAVSSARARVWRTTICWYSLRGEWLVHVAGRIVCIVRRRSCRQTDGQEAMTLHLQEVAAAAAAGDRRVVVVEGGWVGGSQPPHTVTANQHTSTHRRGGRKMACERAHTRACRWQAFS